MILKGFPTILLLSVMLELQACNLPAYNGSKPMTSTGIGETKLNTQSALPVSETPTLLPPSTNTAVASVTAEPENPLVLKDTLCWEGPGPVYLVVSAVKNGERVELLARGSITGWWVIKNPIYHDPCWVKQDVLQIDPGYDLGNLKIFNPPPTPTPTEVDTPTPTPTP